MLVVSRRKSECIYIGDNIKVVIINVGKRGVVRIGIEAPKELTILREELRDKKGEGDAA